MTTATRTSVAGASPKHERSAYLDNTKALLIILVVLGHVLELKLRSKQPGMSVYLLLYAFHMPAFAFVSGMLSRTDAYTKRGGLALLRLFGALAAFQWMHIAWDHYLNGVGTTWYKALTYPAWTLWWLVCLIAWRLMLPLFAQRPGRRTAAFAIAAAVIMAVAIGYLPIDGEQFALVRIFTFFPFFLTGFLAKANGWRVPRKWWTVLGAAAVLGGTYYALRHGDTFITREWLYARQTFAEMGAPVSMGSGVRRLEVMGLAAVLTAAFLQFVPRRTMWLTRLGATTLSIYLWHTLVLMVVRSEHLIKFVAWTPKRAIAFTALLVLVLGTGAIAEFTERAIRGARRSGTVLQRTDAS